MRKKLTTIIITLLLFLAVGNLNILANNKPLGETLVSKSSRRLPVMFVKDAPIQTYEYKGVVVYDFREYFEISDNAEDILISEPYEDIYLITDKGGYQWDFGGFDHTVVGNYIVTITYYSEISKQTRSASVNLGVIEEDVTPPTINGFMDDYFNIAKDDISLEEELEALLKRIRIYDEVDGLITVGREAFEGLENIRTANIQEKEQVKITLRVADKAGNETVKSVYFTVVDNKTPNILNIKIVVLKKGVKINEEELTKHLEFRDNYDDYDELTITYRYYNEIFYENIWQAVTDESRLRGKALVVLKDKTDAEALAYANEQFKYGYETGNYIQYNKPGTDRKSYIRIKERAAFANYFEENEQDFIDTNKVGVQYVLVRAQDSSNNVAQVHFRVVIEDSPSVLKLALIINGSILLVAAVGISLYVLLTRLKKES